MPKSDTLSRTAQTVLAAAAGRDGHSAFPPEHLPAAAKRAVVQSLLKAGLLEEIAAADDGVAWRTTKDGKRLTLRATAAGLAAVGSTIIWDGPTGSIAPENGQTSAPAAEVQPALDPLPTESADPVNVGVTIRPDLRSAAQAVLAAWDDVDGNRPALPGAVEALRAVLATRSATRTGTLSGMPRQPRPDTKRAAVLALLRRPRAPPSPRSATRPAGPRTPCAASSPA